MLKNADDNGVILGTIKSATQAAMDTVMVIKKHLYRLQRKYYYLKMSS